MPRPEQYSDEFVRWVKSLRMSRRAEAARDLLLERGTVTTADLNRMGYDHPPRAIGDLKDAGVTIVTTRVSIDGRRMAQYTMTDTVGSATGARRPLAKRFREALYTAHGYRCAICGGEYTARELQVDHRVPFRIGGNPDPPVLEAFMPLCGSDNRAKSWTCEHCMNWTAKNIETCRECYWSSPSEYRHIAGVEERRLTIVLRNGAVAMFDEIAAIAEAEGRSAGEWVAQRLGEMMNGD